MPQPVRCSREAKVASKLFTQSGWVAVTDGWEKGRLGLMWRRRHRAPRGRGQEGSQEEKRGRGWEGRVQLVIVRRPGALAEATGPDPTLLRARTTGLSGL